MRTLCRTRGLGAWRDVGARWPQGKLRSALAELGGGDDDAEEAFRGQAGAADEVGGALVGGASLTAESFLGIIVAAAELAEG